MRRRAIAMYLENKRPLLLQFACFWESFKHVNPPDTDVVVFGTEDVLWKLPSDVRLIKVNQTPVSRDPEWRGYHFVNSLACLNGDGSEVLEEYSHVLRSDADVFITPAWNVFRPMSFICGRGAYSNSENVRRKTKEVAEHFGMTHRGVHNLGSTYYGPTKLVREVARVSTAITRYLITTEFKTNWGKWPDWYGGVASMYAGEIAMNHLVDGPLEPSILLDFGSTSEANVAHYPHIHCWHTEESFSKFAFERGDYDHHLQEDESRWDLRVIRDYCMAMALRSKR